MKKPANFSRWRALGLGALAGLSVLPVPAGAQDAAEGASFVENFDRLDTQIWYLSDGWNNGNHQNCTWSKEQVSVADGKLRLEFKEGKFKDRDYVCGEIQTKKRFHYGTYEARIRFGAGSGLNSAFFTYIGPVDKKPHDEIDFEALGKDPSKVQLNQYVSAKGGNERLIDVPGDVDTGFNDYAFIWEPERLRYYLNGELVHEVTDPAKIPSNAQKIFFSIWGTDTLTDWMGPFSYLGPVSLDVERLAFTRSGDQCQFPQSVACQLD